MLPLNKRAKEKKHKMDIMELIDNELNDKPFQCEWQICNRVCFMPSVLLVAVLMYTLEL